MGWSEITAPANQIVISTFQDTTYPTVTFNPAAGGTFTVPCVETEINPDEKASSGNVTQLFFYRANLAALSAPLPAIGDSMTWKGNVHRVLLATEDPEDGVRVVIRRTT